MLNQGRCIALNEHPANGGMRVNLQGAPVAPVTPEGQAQAQALIARILPNRAAKATPAPKVKTPKLEPTPAPAPKIPTVIVKKRRRVTMPEP